MGISLARPRRDDRPSLPEPYFDASSKGRPSHFQAQHMARYHDIFFDDDIHTEQYSAICCWRIDGDDYARAPARTKHRAAAFAQRRVADIRNVTAKAYHVSRRRSATSYSFR